MSRHTTLSSDGRKKWVYGWDQPLMSFFLQVHDLDKPEDQQIIVWLGASKKTRLPEIEDLVRAASKKGLPLNYIMRSILSGEKINGI